MSQNSPDLYVYEPVTSNPLSTYSLTPYLAPRGLPWSANGTQLYAVTQPGVSAGGPYTLNVITPSVTTSAITLTGPSSAAIGKKVTLTGALTVGGGGTVPAGTTVTITRIGAGTATSFTVTPDASGEFSLSDTPPAADGYSWSGGKRRTQTSRSARLRCLRNGLRTDTGGR